MFPNAEVTWAYFGGTPTRGRDMSYEKRQAKRSTLLCEVQCAGSSGVSIVNSRLSDLSTRGRLHRVALNELPSWHGVDSYPTGPWRSRVAGDRRQVVQLHAAAYR